MRGAGRLGRRAVAALLWCLLAPPPMVGAQAAVATGTPAGAQASAPAQTEASVPPSMHTAVLREVPASRSTGAAVVSAGPRLTAHWRPVRVAAPGSPTDAPWYAPVLSAIVPGAGQGLLRQQRGIVYAAAEVYLVIRAFESARDAGQQRDAYREIARTVARAPFPGERPDGDWAYYERLEHFLESGAFNRTPGAGLSPETDESTFNGSMWRLARETFWRDPDVAPDPTSAEYQRAIAFYQARAAGDDFRWSWRDAQLQQDVYRQTIDRANESSRRARQLVGLVLANHALSLVDAYVNVRLRVYAHRVDGEQQLGLAGALPLPSRSGAADARRRARD